ncbi:TPA: tetratricopeptide repeat protein [Candidatus Galligastranaerophilus gallistercoris]|nr:tetratricopeptide repeat protein [Candidatus Galligastranaerophilus gallistercoris]
MLKKSASVLFLLLLLMQMPSVFADNYERVNIYYNNGVAYFKDKKYSSAILEFKKVLRQRPYDATVQNALGMAYLARAQYYIDSEKAYKKAINDLRSAIVYLKYWDSAPDESKLATINKAEDNLGYLKRMYAPLKTAEQIDKEAKALRAQGELAASIYEYRQLFKSSVYNKSAYSSASDIYKSLNNEKMAIDCIRNALSIGRDDGMLHFKYALILDDIGNEDAAMDEYSRALEYSNNNKELLDSLLNLWMARSVQDSTDSQALINLGAVLQKKNEFELAKAQYIKARQINPNDPVVLINLASVYTALNDYDNAIKTYDEILLKNQGDLSARFYKAKLYEKKGDIQSAINQYKEILSLKKDDPNAQNALNALLSDMTGEQLGGYLLTEANNNPNNYDAQFKYAFEMHKNKAYAPAIEYYKKAISINPNKPEPFINLAQIFMLQNDYEKAANVTAHGLSIMPDNKDLLNIKTNLEKTNANNLYAKGAEFYNAGDYQSALNHYLKIKYQTPEILTMIANCYYELKDNSKAIEYYNRVLANNPKDENALFMIANIMIAGKNEQSAREYLNKILTINPNNIEAKNTLSALNEGEEAKMLDSAITMYENKDYENALTMLDKIISKNPKNPYAYYYKGAIFEQTGKLDNALIEYKNSISKDPNFSLSYYMIAVVSDTKEDYTQAVNYYEKFIQLKQKEGVEDEYSTYAKTRCKELKDYLSQK